MQKSKYVKNASLPELNSSKWVRRLFYVQLGLLALASYLLMGEGLTGVLALIPVAAFGVCLIVVVTFGTYAVAKKELKASSWPAYLLNCLLLPVAGTWFFIANILV